VKQVPLLLPILILDIFYNKAFSCSKIFNWLS